MSTYDQKFTVSLIVAADLNNAIGRGNTIPWRVKRDMMNFQTLTLGKTVLMGRKTAQSIGRPLKERRNLVMTRDRIAPYKGQEVVTSIKDAIRIAGSGELCIIGGGEIYKQALDLGVVDVIHFTRVHAEIEDADAWLPKRLQFTGGLVDSFEFPRHIGTENPGKPGSKPDCDTHTASYFHIDRRIKKNLMTL